MRLTIVQYGGDYREAWERFERGGQATYQAQKYSVGLVGSIAERLEQVAVVCALTDAAYDVILPNKVRAIGGGFSPGFDANDMVPVIAQTLPDRLLLTTPMRPALKWARRNNVRTVAQLADSFRRGHLLRRLKHRLLASELNSRNVEWVSNHGVASCLSLVQIGVRPEKIIPWDWPPSHVPGDHAPRRLKPSKSRKLVYVGSVTEEKGVGDLLQAIAFLERTGFRASLRIIGPEPNGNMRNLCDQLGLNGVVDFAGVIFNEDVPLAMRSADIVVIPSRHDYPEGLPLTIYEALATRTPIVASDHPMFRGALVQEESALIFDAANVEALATSISRLAQDTKLYARLSENSLSAWQALQLPVTWGAVLEKWLGDTPAERDWLRAHRFTSGLYDQQIAARIHA
jgi:hypothetical protein